MLGTRLDERGPRTGDEVHRRRDRLRCPGRSHRGRRRLPHLHGAVRGDLEAGGVMGRLRRRGNRGRHVRRGRLGVAFRIPPFLLAVRLRGRRRRARSEPLRAATEPPA
jgi:hypothetical protein